MEIYDIGVCNSLIEQGGDVEWFTCDRTKGTGASPELKIKKYFKGMYGKRSAALRFCFFIRGLFLTLIDLLKQPPEIVYAHIFTFSIVELLIVFASLLTKSKVFVNVHDPVSFGESGSPIIKYIFGKLFKLKKVVVTTHTNYSKKVFSEIFPRVDIKLMPHSDIDFIYTPWNESQFSGAAVKHNSDELKVLFFGQIKQTKGVDILLKAWSQVIKSIPKARLSIVGRCWQNDCAQYKKIIKDLDLEGTVAWDENYVSDSDVPALFHSANIVVLPYTRIYSSGVLLRAMGYGTPVIVSNLEAFTEIITHDESGLVFHSNDIEDLAVKIQASLEEPSKMESLSKNAQKVLEKDFSWSVVGKRMYMIFKDALNVR